VSSPLIQAFTNSFSHLSSKWIEETLLSGYSIVCDRYYYSGMVYSAAKKNPRLSLEWAKSPDIGLPRPDRVIFLDLEPKEAARRGGFGGEKYEKKEMQMRVRELFLDLQHCRDHEQEDMRVINAGRSIEEVGAEILKDVLAKVEEIESDNVSEMVLPRVEAWHPGCLTNLESYKREASKDRVNRSK
jgi:dTMP kinase